MKTLARLLCTALIAMPVALDAQAAPAHPVADALRMMAEPTGTHLLQAAEAMPAGRYGFRPTPAQMTFGEIVLHIRRDNRTTCSALSGVAAPAEGDPSPTAPKDTLVAALKRSLTFCHSALQRVDDAHLGEPVTWYGQSTTRAMPALGLLSDWSDHYGQLAIYLRLNGVLPPTARGRK